MLAPGANVELRPGTIVDRYTIESILGEGGMGTVYKARHNELGSPHAIKVLRMRGEQVRARLVQEGRLQSGLQHPAVVRVTDLITVEGNPALVLEYVEGETLVELLRRGPLDADLVDRFARRLFEGVIAAHKLGLVHRDLKPSNILVASIDGQPWPKIADFGLAKALFESGPIHTATGSSFGTPAYMAPEQFQDASRVDARADVFSLGAILYELATGWRAFQGSSTADLMWKSLRGDYRPPRSLAPDLPEAWERAIVGALEPDPKQRIASVEALSRIWSGLPPEVSAHTAVPSRVSESHPSMEELADPTFPDPVRSHLESCASCRVERQLYFDTFELAPSRASAWPAGLVGGLVASLAALAILAAACGGISKITNQLGPFWVPLLGVATAGGARFGVGLRRLQAGQICGLSSWLLAPMLLVGIGALGCMAGVMVAANAVQFGPVDWVPTLIAAGASVALYAWSSALLLAAPMLIAIIALLAWARRSEARTPTFSPWPVGLAVAGGGALWLTEALLATDRTATLLVYLAVVAAGGLLSLLPDGEPEDAAARLLGAMAAVGVGTAAAMGVQILDLQQLLEAVMHSWASTPTDGLAAAEALAAAWREALSPWTLGWMGLAVGVASPVLLSRPMRAALAGPGAHRGQLLRLVLALGILVVAPDVWNARVTQDFVDHAIPAWKAAAVASLVPALHLRQQADALVVVEGASPPLQPGDLLIAAEGATVTEVASLIERLAALPREAPLELTVERAGRLVELQVPWASESTPSDREAP